ncbi:porin family protein [Maribacter sp. 4G9]|uniref:porin family protein n=1 Tax=Maribacter sp. 4G9 TaxID=1889777 RepID=UPI000C15D53B|nr:porin family protein [Maribacter sp. 4G9]PIB37862.1 hypothetical protein BFP75_18925 [Maribacter sp. 4G9]
MNKLATILFFIACAGISESKAQVAPGIKLGYNESRISKTRLEPKSGLYIGGFLDIPISARYAIQPEVLYSSQGGASVSPDFGDVQIDYLSVMAANKFYVGPAKGFHFNLGLGLDINLKNNFVNLFNGDADGEISPFDVVVFGGMVYEFNFGLILEARYKQGTVSVDFFVADDLYEEDGSNLNGVFQLGASYKFKRK